MLNVIEVFSSIQGEGSNTGLWMTFLRLSRCNLSCSWCDTKYSWKSGTTFSNRDLYTRVLRADPDPRWIIFTGGEPTLQQEGMVDFMAYVRERLPSVRFAIETNGTVEPWVMLIKYLDHITLSPKPCQTGIDKACQSISYWMGRVCSENVFMELKFVVTQQADLKMIERIYNDVPLYGYNIPIILQPNGQVNDYPEAARRLVGWVKDWHLKNEVRVMLQTHKVLWNNERGK